MKLRQLIQGFCLVSLPMFLIPNGTIQAQDNSRRIASENLESAVLEVKIIGSGSRKLRSDNRIMRNYQLTIAPGDIHNFYDYVNERAWTINAGGDSLRTGLFGMAPPYREQDSLYSLWLPDRNILFTVLRDLTAFESIINIFAIWSKNSDSLTLECVSKTTLLTGIGSATIEKYYTIGPEKTLIIGKTNGGDAGDHWGSIWFGLLGTRCRINIFYELKFLTSLCKKEEKLEYNIDDITLNAEIIKQKRTMLNCDDYGNIEYSDWKIIVQHKLDLREMILDLDN